MNEIDKKVSEYIDRANKIVHMNGVAQKHDLGIGAQIEIAKMIQLEELNQIEITGEDTTGIIGVNLK